MVVHQARAKTAEEEVAAVRRGMQVEQEQLRAQVEESTAVVGQWSEAYQSLQAQYEAAQVGAAGPLSNSPHHCLKPLAVSLLTGLASQQC